MFILRIALAQMAMSKNIDSNLQKSLDFCDKAKDCDLLFFTVIQLSPFFPQYEKSDVTEYAMNTNSFEIINLAEKAKGNSFISRLTFILNRTESLSFSLLCYPTDNFLKPNPTNFDK